MTERAGQLVEGAERAIASARRELEAGDAESASERASVAMLRLARACLEAGRLSPVQAQAVCLTYGQRFARTGPVYSTYFRWLLDALDLRKASAADLGIAIDAETVTTFVERAEIFRDAVVRFLDRGA